MQLLSTTGPVMRHLRALKGTPNSPLVQVTTMVRNPWPGWVASTPPVVDDSLSGWACTAIGVRICAMGGLLCDLELEDGQEPGRGGRLAVEFKP